MSSSGTFQTDEQSYTLMTCDAGTWQNMEIFSLTLSSSSVGLRHTICTRYRMVSVRPQHGYGHGCAYGSDSTCSIIQRHTSWSTHLHDSKKPNYAVTYNIRRKTETAELTNAVLCRLGLVLARGANARHQAHVDQQKVLQ